MLSIAQVAEVIDRNNMMERDDRRIAEIIFLLFGTIDQLQFASVNFFSDSLASFGYPMNKKDTKAVHSRINNMERDEYLEKLNLTYLLEEDRIAQSSRAIGRISHDGNNRTRSLFRLTPKGNAKLNKIILKLNL